jgi:NAD-dependent SIR2 family protein deacetylase
LGDIGHWLNRNDIKNVIVISGAGVSVSAGIPDFRSPGTGLYDNLEAYNLPFPEAVFDLNFFKSNPQPFCSLAKEIWPGRYCPTLTHAFIKLLNDKGILLRNYTQNIDGMEVLSGVNPDKVIECHGNFRSARCVDCKISYPGDKCQELMSRGEVPICPYCNHPNFPVVAADSEDNGDVRPPKPSGYVKPDIVFFGESLPSIVRESIQEDLTKCDLLLVMGTSLTVYPVALLPLLVDHYTPRVLFNRELVGNFCGRQTSTDDDFSCTDSMVRVSNDVFVPGDCDNSVREISRISGWESELDQIYQGIRQQYGHLEADRLSSKASSIVADSDDLDEISAVQDDDALSNTFIDSTPQLSDEEDDDLLIFPRLKKHKTSANFASTSREVSYCEGLYLG